MAQNIGEKICKVCGMPLDLCICESIIREQNKVIIYEEKRKYDKIVTILSGFSDVNLKELASNLKKKLGCGGTVKNSIIELQGRQSKRVQDILIKEGFLSENIETRNQIQIIENFNDKND